MDSETKNIDNRSQESNNSDQGESSIPNLNNDVIKPAEEEVQEKPRKRLEDLFATKRDLCQFIYKNGLTQLKELAIGCEWTPLFKIIRKEIQQRENMMKKYVQLDKDDSETIELKFQRKMISKNDRELALGLLARRKARQKEEIARSTEEEEVPTKQPRITSSEESSSAQ